jgi:2-dehydro-3-deoxyphosphogluconate aldolase/(4S)-4-hydroxy-2-oxoglutarate aldolase
MALSKIEVLAEIRRIGLVPVLRAESEEQAIALAEAIADGGVTCLEVTMTVPGAVRVIARLAKERPEILLGAGTVLDAETAHACIEEGAQFVVSPAFNPKTVAMCQKHEIAVLPGALTPTEILTAWEAGADVVKVFPASAMGGAKYLKSIKAPLPQIELIPTGGVSLTTARSFWKLARMRLALVRTLWTPRQWLQATRGRSQRTRRSILRSCASSSSRLDDACCLAYIAESRSFTSFRMTSL